jgi:hypothetical protein
MISQFVSRCVLRIVRRMGAKEEAGWVVFQGC